MMIQQSHQFKYCFSLRIKQYSGFCFGGFQYFELKLFFRTLQRNIANNFD